MATPKQFRRRTRWGLIVGMILAILAFGAVMASADDVSNNLDATVDATLEDMPLTVGGANGSVQFHLAPTNTDQKSGCNLTGAGSQLVLGIASDDTSVATLSASSVTITACDPALSGAISVHPVAVGTATVTLSFTSVTTSSAATSASDYNLAPASFTVHVTNPPSANVAPVIAWTANPSAADEGQTKTYSFSITDSDSSSWTFASTYPQCGTGGNLVANSDSINNAAMTGTFQCSFPDGPATPTVKVKVTDGTDPSNELTQAVTVNNVNPVITSFTCPTGPVAVNTLVSLANVPFTDDGVLDTHTASFNWDDTSSSAGAVSESNGSGTVTGTHTYTTAGIYEPSLTVTDKDNGSDTESCQYVVVYDPSAGFVTGGGWIMSPAGAYAADPDLVGKATFGFVSKYKKGANAPDGNTEFQFHAASLNFSSSSYQWLVVGGAKATYKGSGTINGTGGYGFLLSAVDGQLNGGGGTDKFRIKIWDTSTSEVVYDNLAGAADTADPITVLGGGSIVVHTK